MSFAGFFYANENNVLALVLFLLIGLFVIINRKKFSVEGKIIFVYRTKLGLKIMKSLSRFKRIVNIYSIIGVFTGIGAIILTIYIVIPYFQSVITHPSTTAAGATLVLPVSGVPGIVGVPIIYWIIALILVVTTHEASHGIVALSKKIKLKSSGFGFFLGILPLAFVEPDQKQFEKAHRFDRLKVLAAGSFTNVVTGVIFLILFLLLSNYLISTNSIAYLPLYLHVTGIVAGSQANISGLLSGQTINKVNGMEFTSVQQLFTELSMNPTKNVTLTATTGQNYTMKKVYNTSLALPAYSGYGVSGAASYINKTLYLAENLEHPYLGFFGEVTGPTSGFLITPFPTYIAAGPTLSDQILFWFDGLFFWILLIAFGLGLANFLPIFYITDGCKMVYELLGYKIKDKTRLLNATNAVIIAFSVLFLLLTPLGTFLFKLL